MRQSLNKPRHREGALKRSPKVRVLRFDRLEDRRLMAGLEVVVFNDPLAARQLSSESSAAAEKVVYVDLNADGNHQSNEPLSVADQRGIATFADLQAGSYLVRLLGQNRTLAQTTDTSVAPSGTWLSNLDLQQSLTWESDTQGWFTSGARLVRMDLDSGRVQDSIALGGNILSATMLDANTGVALVGTASASRLIQFDLRMLTTRTVADVGAGATQVLAASASGMNKTVLVRQTSSNGQGLFAWNLASDPSFAPGMSLARTAWVDGLSSSASVQTVGNNAIAIVDSNGGINRLSLYQSSSDGLSLSAEREFSETIRVSSASADGKKIAVDTDRGMLVLSNTLGLPVLSVLANAAGPSAFDTSRGVLLTSSKANPGRLLGWSMGDWTKSFDVVAPDTTTREQANRTVWSLGFLNDTLIGLRDGSLYRHALNIASAARVAISDAVLSQVAIGIRSRSANAAPALAASSALLTSEDQPLVISENQLQSTSTDNDGDRLYYVLRNTPKLGALNWSTTSGGVYAPILNANGSDQFVVQAYDGRDWSAPQTFGIQIAPVNDSPTKIDLPSSIEIPELMVGAKLTSVRVLDPDTDSDYQYIVSDSRFAVQNGQLVLLPGVSLDFEAQSLIVLTVTATDSRSRDTISQKVSVNVLDRNDPPLGIVMTGTGQVPEKRPGFVVGNINVMDPDSNEVYDITVSDSRFEVVGNTVRVKAGTGISYVAPGWIDLTFTAKSRTNGTTIQRSDRLSVIRDTTPYHNDMQPADVDGDGKVTPLDPLIVINYINAHGPSFVPQMGEGESNGNMDVDGDGKITPLDILIIVNELNRRGVPTNSIGGGSGLKPEGESNLDVPPRAPAVPSVPISQPVRPAAVQAPLTVPTPPPSQDIKASSRLTAPPVLVQPPAAPPPTRTQTAAKGRRR
ncbi:MAG: dockerin type I domain-containing protein [Pirellula sp.]